MSTNFGSTKIDQWRCLDDETLIEDHISITTASSSIDKHFFPIFNGVPLKSLTEIFGFPGTGKTCFATQLAINTLAQNPSNLVVYIDTSSNFTIERFSQIYRARKDFTMSPISDFLDRLILLPVVDLYDLFIQLTRMEIIIEDLFKESKLKLKLLIIDNIASPFKLIPSHTIEKRIRITNKLANDLRCIATKYNCAVLTVNQLTRKMQPNPDTTDLENKFIYQPIPSLGQTWRNHLDTSIYLRNDEFNGRIAELAKSIFKSELLFSPKNYNKSDDFIKFFLEETGFIEVNKN